MDANMVIGSSKISKLGESFFWDGLYTERNILWAFRNDESMKNEFTYAFVDVLEFIRVNIFRLPRDYSSNRDFCLMLARTINDATLYFNLKENKNPKYVYDFVAPYDSEICSAVFGHCYDCLKCLRNYAFRFGLLPSSFLNITMKGSELLEFVKSDAYPCFRDDFVVRDKSDEFDCCVFNYKARDGESFFEKEVSSDCVYLYFNALENGFDLKKEMCEVGSVVNIAKKSIRKNYGNSSIASVQVRVNYKHEDFSRRYVLEIIEKGVLAYQNWACPSLVKKSQPLVDLTYHVNMLKSEQISGEVRAIGLWLWDLVFFNKIKFVNAIDMILSSKINHCRIGSDDRVL